MSKTPRRPFFPCPYTADIAAAAVTGDVARRRHRCGPTAVLAAILWVGHITYGHGAEVEPADLPYSAPIHLDDSSLPDPARTPGDWPDRTKTKDLCDDESATHQARPSSTQCDGAFAAYRIPLERRFQYQCRYLVPLSVGGTSTSLNVWPQPAPEAAFKDALDVELHKQICSGDLSPAEAQREVASDWVKAYRKYLLPFDPPPVVLEDHAPVDTPARTAPVTPASVQSPVSDLSPQLSPPDRQRRPSQATGPGTGNGQNSLSPSAGGSPHVGTGRAAAAPVGINSSRIGVNQNPGARVQQRVAGGRTQVRLTSPQARTRVSSRIPGVRRR